MRLTQKTKKQIYFFSFFICITIPILLLALSPLAIINDDSVTISDKTIRYDWLNVQLENDPSDLVEFSKGGLKLTEFENDGIFSRNDETRELVYKSRANFMFEINAYTDVDIFNVWPNINTHKQQLFLYLSHHWFYWFPWGESWQYYYVTAQTIDYGSTFLSHDYDFTLPISIDIAPDFANLDGTTINGINIRSADYLYQIKAVEVANVRDGTCGDYEDLYTDQSWDGVNVEMDQFVEDSITNEYALGRVAEYDLGVDPLDTRDHTIQNSKIDTFPQGHTEIYPSSNQPVIFNEHIALRPEITESIQEFEVRDAGLVSDGLFGWDDVERNPSTKEVDRVRSAHVYNQFIHKEYKVSVNFLATIQLDAQMYESFLADPYLKLGDWLWDNELGGTTDVVVVPHDSGIEMFWAVLGDMLFGSGGWIILVIIIIVVIVVIYIFLKKFGMPLIKKRMGVAQTI